MPKWFLFWKGGAICCSRLALQMTFTLTSAFQDGAGDQRGVCSHMLRWVFMWIFCHIKNAVSQSPSTGHIWALTICDKPTSSSPTRIPLTICPCHSLYSPGPLLLQMPLSFQMEKAQQVEFQVQSLFYVLKVRVLRSRAIALNCCQMNLLAYLFSTW